MDCRRIGLIFFIVFVNTIFGRMVPKTMYMYWHSKKLPDLIRRMVRLARRQNPTWKIVVITPRARFAKPDGFHDLSVPAQSDWVRLHFLAKHGGVWMDISCIHLHPVEHWVDVTSSRLQGFLWPSRGTVMESWAFAAPPAHPFVVAWRDEFARAIAVGLKAYADDVPSVSSMSGFDELGHYLAIHMAWRVVWNRRNRPRDEVRLARSNDRVSGPFGLHRSSQWDADKLVVNMLRHSAARYARMPFVKLTSCDRGALEDAMPYDRRECAHIPKLLGLCEPRAG